MSAPGELWDSRSLGRSRTIGDLVARPRAGGTTGTDTWRWGRLCPVLLIALVALIACQVVGLIGLFRRGDELIFSAAMIALWFTAVIVAGLWVRG